MNRARLAAALLVAIGAGAPARAAAQDRILVMPFENVQRDPSIVWLGEAAAVLVADDLNARGAHAITRAERQDAFDRLQVPAVATLSDATIIRIGQVVGASEVIVGSFERRGDTLIVEARSIGLEAGKIQADVTDRGAIGDLFAIFDRVSAGVLGSGATSNGPPSASADMRPPVDAFENYIKGLLAETPETAVRYLDTALAIDPHYDEARLALWDVYVDQSEYARAIAAVGGVSVTSAYWHRARFLAGLAELEAKKYDEAFATYQALADQNPTAAVMNNLGVVQLRRGSTPSTGVPTYYFTQAAMLDPGDADYDFNLGYAYWEAHDPAAAIYWLREAVRRSPADGDAHFVLGAALEATGSLAESARERELAGRLSSNYEERNRRPGPDPVPRDLERVKKSEVEPQARRIETRIASTAQRDQQSLATFYLDRGRREFQQEHDREASDDLARAIYLSPYLAEAHLLVGRIHLRNGRVREAIDALKVSLWSAETADAHLWLARAYLQAKDQANARKEAERALMLDPGSAEARGLLDMLKSP